MYVCIYVYIYIYIYIHIYKYKQFSEVNALSGLRDGRALSRGGALQLQGLFCCPLGPHGRGAVQAGAPCTLNSTL